MDTPSPSVGRLLALLTVGLLGATAAAVGTVGLLGWTVATLFAVAPAVEALTPLLLPFVVGVVLGFPLAVVGFGGVAAALVSEAMGARDRLQRRVGRFADDHETELSMLGLSDLVEQLDHRSPEARAEDRLERLKSAYVAGDIDDREFERRVEALVDEADVDPNRVLSLRESAREAGDRSERVGLAAERRPEGAAERPREAESERG